MSKCDLSIELDRNPPHYRPGEVLKGKVAVRVNQECTCTALTVELRWRSHGAGNRDEGPLDLEPLGSFQWSPQMTDEFPFELRMPDGPVSYHGHFINVDWYVTARADVPWAIDPKAEQDVLLLPAPAEAEASPTYRGTPHRVARRYDLGTAPAQRPVWLRWIFILAAPVFMVILFHDAFSDAEVNWTFLLPLGLVCVFMLRMAWKDIRNFAAKQKVGELDLSTEPATATRDEPITVRAVLLPKGKGEINGVRAKLIGEETAVSGSGTNSKTHRHVLDLVEADMAGAVAFAAGERQEFVADLKLPKDAAPTFRAKNNNVRWMVNVMVDIKGWPDLEESLELDVHPS